MPVVTITSDIGQYDYLTGAIKGELLKVNAGFNIVDVTHNISPFNYHKAAYICRNVIKHYPAGTFHLIFVNLFDTRPDHMLLVEHNGQYIGCADNGFITMVLEELPQKVIALPLKTSENRNTLYCASVFAEAINAIDKGKKIEEVGDNTVSIVVKNHLRPLLSSDWIEGQILFIDNFENIVVNITKEEFEEQRKGRSFHIVFKRDEVIDKISETYADVQESEKLALFNSAGYLEIAINKGNAAGLFGLQGFSDGPNTQNAYSQNRYLYQTVKVLFDK
jgi:S-adenosyl-L-methionine hydrolase (adenosine-forming)